MDIRRQRGKILGVGRLSPGADGKQRPPMEGIFEGDDAALLRAIAVVGIFARQLQRRLVGFSAGVTEENPVGKGGVDKPFRQPQRRLVSVAIAGMPELTRLFAQGAAKSRMGMTQRVNGDTASKVDLLFPLLIPQAGTLTTNRNNRSRRIHRQHPLIDTLTRY